MNDSAGVRQHRVPFAPVALACLALACAAPRTATPGRHADAADELPFVNTEAPKGPPEPCGVPGPPDALEITEGPFIESPERLRYHSAVDGTLIPGGPVLLKMLVLSSFVAEEAVYLTARGKGCLVTSARPVKSIWGSAEWYGPAPSAYAPPDVDRATAEISGPTCRALRRLWAVALVGARQPNQQTGGPMPDGSFCAVVLVDGTDFYFADGGTGMNPRAAEAPRGPGAKVDALVALGRDLLAYPRAPEADRPQLDAAIGRRATALTEVFRRALPTYAE